jgi:iron complex transport system substrate-binding protein
VKKPEFQWQTRKHRARREAEPPGGEWADDPRAEAFTLEFDDGRRGRAVVGLHRQQVDRHSGADPDLVHAIRCWLAARGGRATELYDDGGWLLERTPFSVDELGTAPTGPVQRIVTLAPSNAEIVAALDRFGDVVACEDSSDYPPEVDTVERLGPDLGPDLDRVAALQPDLVVSSLSVPGMERVVTGLRARALPQLVLAPTSYAAVLADIARVGAVLGEPARAQAVVDHMQRQRDQLEAHRRQPPVRVYLEWWPKPMFTPGGDCYSNELIELAGGTNVFGQREGSSVQIEAAELVAADPDVCFVSWCGVAPDKLDPGNLIEREGLQGLRAAAQGHVYRLDEAFSGRPGPRMLEASRRMAEAIARL